MYTIKKMLKVDWLRAISKKKKCPNFTRMKKKLSRINEEDI